MPWRSSVFYDMKSHVNIPIFIPHLGCPNQCVFCNQRTISGVSKFDINDVRREIDEALSTVGDNVSAEIAFFGGSFTGIDRDLMISLLELAHEYVLNGRVSAIRCSTRPDYINSEVLSILKRYRVKTIELGLQSCDDNVLNITKRGHTAADEITACDMIVNSGFELVGQMMIGLPGSSPESEIATARFIVEHRASAARIYPTVVFYDTELRAMAQGGQYYPLTTEDAVVRSATVLQIFVDNNIDVIRIGLCASENLSDASKYFSGPNHPALGEMVESELYRRIISGLIDAQVSKKDVILTISVAKGCLSKAIGQRKTNKLQLMREYGYADVRFTEDENLSDYKVKIKEERKRKCI